MRDRGGTCGPAAVSSGLMKRTWFHSLMWAWASAAVVTGGCRAPAVTRVEAPKPPATPGAPVANAAAPTPSGRPQIAIEGGASDGKLTVETRDAKAAAAQAAMAALTPNEVEALHARMEPLPDLAMQNAGAPT